MDLKDVSYRNELFDSLLARVFDLLWITVCFGRWLGVCVK